MKNKWIAIAALALTVALSGCETVRRAEERPVQTNGAALAAPDSASEPTGEQTVSASVPADGDPSNVTCKGSYTGEADLTQTAATVGKNTLTVGQLQGFYWAEVAQYRQEHPEDGPDFDAPLDSQPCPVSDGVNSWQQYFLREALDAWHTAQALIRHSLDTPIETEEAYQPNLDNYAKYMVDIPATRFLYGYSDRYRRNTMHEAYLDELPGTLDTLAREKGYADASAMAQAAFGTGREDLTAYAEIYNQGYMYLTELSYGIRPTAEEITAWFDAHGESAAGKDSGNYVDVRHMLLIPAAPEGDPGAVTVGPDGKVSASEEQWEACLQQAEKAKASLTAPENLKQGPEAAFADMAHKTSQDTGTALDGGSLRRIARGQLIPELDSWCFDDARQPGDVGIIRTEYGVCILYFSGSTPIWYAEAEDALKAEQLDARMEQIKESYPMEVDYGAITLAPAEATVAAGDILYPDVAHERYPEVPLYLQQDYPKTKFGAYPIRSYGCGITSMAMLATYMADEPLTPPVMCERYGNYSTATGTDGMIFNKEPSAMGFYCLRRSYEPKDVMEALKQGYIAISVHSPGYWTRAGHYIVIEKVNEDGTVQVRDSNLFNYNNSYRPAQVGHLEDRHSWASVTGSTLGFWIFDYKVTHIPICRRCGDIGQTNSHVLTQDYTCEKCRPALLRRSAYLKNA